MSAFSVAIVTYGIAAVISLMVAALINLMGKLIASGAKVSQPETLNCAATPVQELDDAAIAAVIAIAQKC